MRSIDQPLPLYLQQPRSLKVDFPNQSGRIQAEKTDGGEVIELDVFVPRQLELFLGLAQLGILHLQFDLVDLQFVEQPLRLGLGPWIGQLCGVGTQLLFRLTAQFGGGCQPALVLALAVAHA